MEKEIVTFAEQEITSRLANRKHFLKDFEFMINWERIKNIIFKIEIRRQYVAVSDAFSAEVTFRTKLLKEINFHLSKYNIKISEGVIVDTTLVETKAFPRKKEII